MTGDDAASTTFLRVLLLVVGTLSVLLVLPFSQPLLLAGLLAYLVAPVNDRLARRLGATVGAAVTTTATILVVLVPLLALVVVAIEQAISVTQTVDLADLAAIESVLLERLGAIADPSMLGDSFDDTLRTALRGLLGRLAGVVGVIPALAIGSVVFLFSFFSLLRNGDALLAWLRTATPLDDVTMDELFQRTDDLLWAAVVGNVVVAALQAILTVIGFLVVGFDNIVFWGVLTFVLSLLPIIGASVVWIPAVLYLVIVGDLPAAVGLLVYGSIVVSGSDNIVRPLAMRRGARLDTGLLVLGIFGGVALFGFLGLFVGPVVLGLAKAIVELLVEQRSDGASG